MMLRGIAAYARPARPWSFTWDSPSADGIERLLELDLNGILAKHLDSQGVELIERSGLPTVHIGDPLSSLTIAQVNNDNVAIGQMAAAYFTSRGYRHLAYYARVGTEVDQRWAGYDAGLRKKGLSCHALDAHPGHPAHPRPGKPSLRRENEKVRLWLSALPKPVAILCVSDNAALVVAEHCRELGIVVPDEIALLGVDNDIPVCALAAPPLSSIQIAGERMGYIAAELLDAMMTERKAAGIINLPPIRVVSRRSTDTVVASDPLVARALSYMRQNFADADCNNDFFSSLRCSRRTVERKFRAATGLSPAQAWLRFRLEEAERLLVDTEFSVEYVADRCGFSDIRQLQVAFRKVLKQTPSQFRRHAIPSFRAGA